MCAEAAASDVTCSDWGAVLWVVADGELAGFPADSDRSSGDLSFVLDWVIPCFAGRDFVEELAPYVGMDLSTLYAFSQYLDDVLGVYVVNFKEQIRCYVVDDHLVASLSGMVCCFLYFLDTLVGE